VLASPKYQGQWGVYEYFAIAMHGLFKINTPDNLLVLDNPNIDKEKLFSELHRQ
jgi:hypothetical protein